MKFNSRNILQIIVSIAIIFTITSCDDFFDQSAGNRVNPDAHYQSTIDLEVSLAGVLAPLQEAMPKLIMLDGLMSDMMDLTDNVDVTLSEINEHRFSNSNPYTNTSELYQVIINANEVLQNLHRITKADPNFDEFYITATTNALIGVRSWAYFTLLKIHNEVALIDGNMASLPKGGLTYIGKEAMLDTLISHLTPNLHLDLDLDELLFQNFFNTKALIGEIYLEKNDYSNAAEFLKLGMESYGNTQAMYKVDRAFSAVAWRNIFINAEGNIAENIAVIPFSSTNGQVNPITGVTLYNDQYLVKPSRIIINKYANQVPLKGEIGDIVRGIGVTIDTINSETYYIKKYALDEGEPYGSDIIISRAADIHLLLAEALNRLGQYQTALILLNGGFNAEKSVPAPYNRWNRGFGIRGRATLASHTIPEGMTDLNQIMLYVEDLIMEERSMELAFEGKRWFDLVRIAKRRGDVNYIADKVASKHYNWSTVEQVREKLRNESNWYIPLSK